MNAIEGIGMRMKAAGLMPLSATVWPVSIGQTN
jgi:hypothetical protein